jgi:hypothetical protein
MARLQGHHDVGELPDLYIFEEIVVDALFESLLHQAVGLDDVVAQNVHRLLVSGVLGNDEELHVLAQR